MQTNQPLTQSIERRLERKRRYRRRDVAPTPTLAELERDHIASVLQATGGNISHAAEILDIDRKTLASRLDRYAQHRAAK